VKVLILRPFLFLLIGVLPLSSIANEFEKFQKLVFPLVTKGQKKGARSSHGSAFVVNTDGKLLTNYHVISRLFKQGELDKKKSIYIKIKGIEYRATLEKFDVSNDLALVSVPYKFEQAVKLSETSPKPGDEILSLGFHEIKYLSINQGRYNSVMENTVNELMAISVPVNPGMSGGPLLNKNYEVIGVNVLAYRNKQSAAYGINVNRVRSFLGKENMANLEEELKNQSQKSFTTLVGMVKKWDGFKLLGDYTIPNFDHLFDCGESSNDKNLDDDEDDENKNQILTNSIGCMFDTRLIPLHTQGVVLKRFGFYMLHLKGSENTKEVTYYSYLNKQVNRSRKKLRFYIGDNTKCDNSIVENKFGQTFKVSICAHPMKKIPRYMKGFNYHKYVIRFATMTEEMNDLIGYVRFISDPELANDVATIWLNNIYFSPEKAAAENSEAQRGLASEKEETDGK
jgi:hypothetical protein